MELVSLPDFDVIENNAPRRLTDDEIKFISDHVPVPLSADSLAADISRQCVVEWVMEVLRESLIDPSAISELIDYIILQHKRSQVIPGTPVGITAAEAVGATTTQMTLNSVAPHEKILFQELSGKTHLVEIGKWIDELLAANMAKIQFIPENRTEYLELAEPVKIATCDETGVVTWENITAVTRHLPVGELVKINTASGREVTATQSKSLLIWDGEKLVQREGKDANVGDLVPIIDQCPDPYLIMYNIFVGDYLASDKLLGELPKTIALDKEFGLLIGLYISRGFCNNSSIAVGPKDEQQKDLLIDWCAKYNLSDKCSYFWAFDKICFNIRSAELSDLIINWIGDTLEKVDIPNEILMSNKDFISGFLEGYYTNISVAKNIDDKINFLVSRNNKHDEQLEDIKNNVMLDPIVSIELVPPTKYVYDLTVPVTTNFSLFNGLCCADTFHKAGSSKSASFGIDAMRDLIFARKTPKNESCTIYFEDKTLTFEEVLNTRKFIVGSMVADFIKRKGKVLDYEIDTVENLGKPWWYNSAIVLYGKEIPKTSKVLRLYLNTAEMYKQGVTIHTLASVLEKEAPSSVITVYGPMSEGIIDVYPEPKIINETIKKFLGLKKEQSLPIKADLLEETFLDSIVLADLANIRVKGITGIKQLYPFVSPVMRIVAYERLLERHDLITLPSLEKYLGTAWVIFYNIDAITLTGISRQNLAKLYDLAGIQVLGSPKGDENTQIKLFINIPKDTRTPKQVIQEALIKDREVQIRVAELLEDLREIYDTDVENSILSPLAKVGNLIDNIVSEKKLDKSSSKDSWEIVHNNENVRELLTLSGLKIEKEDKDKLIVTIPTVSGTPGEYVNAKIAKDKKDNKLLLQRLTDERDNYIKAIPKEQRKGLFNYQVIVQPTPLMKAAEFVIAETDGANLKELLAIPGVDKQRTTCNNMFTIAATLGIEAARSFLIRALTTTILNNNSYVHPANIMVIAEFITSRGEPYGATYTGISRQPGGHLSLATLERAGKVFIQSAIRGEEERGENISMSIAVGKRIDSGSGYSSVAQDIIENGQVKTVVNDALFTVHTRDESMRPEGLRSEISPTDYDYNEEFGALGTVSDLEYDLTAGDKETNLHGVSVVPSDIVKAAGPREIRVVKQILEDGIETMNVPADSISALDQIISGIPTEDIVIKPLMQGLSVAQDVKLPQPIISTGLVSEVIIEAPPLSIPGIPAALVELLKEYLMEVEKLPEEEISYGRLEEVKGGLPEMEIPDLPDITDVVNANDYMEIRREQVRGLQPINVSALEDALTGK